MHRKEKGRGISLSSTPSYPRIKGELIVPINHTNIQKAYSKEVSYGLRNLNTWSPVHGTGWGGLALLEGGVLLEAGFESSQPPSISSSFSLLSVFG